MNYIRQLPPCRVPQTKQNITVPHNHPYISSCNCLQFGASSYICRDGYVGQWQSTLFVAHEVVVATLYNPYLVHLLCLPLPFPHLSDFLVIFLFYIHIIIQVQWVGKIILNLWSELIWSGLIMPECDANPTATINCSYSKLDHLLWFPNLEWTQTIWCDWIYIYT